LSDIPAGYLSAGQKRRLGLARLLLAERPVWLLDEPTASLDGASQEALINAPEVLLLDEPTASLDPDTADWVRTRLERYRLERGATVLLASHNMAEVERLADRVILLDSGRILEDEAPSALIKTYGRETLEEVFLDVVRGRARGPERDETPEEREAS